MQRLGARLSLTAAEKFSRSTASAPPAGNSAAVGGAHNQRAGVAHLLMQQADGVVERRRRSGRNWSRPARPGHAGWASVLRTGRISCSIDRHAAPRRLPGGLAAGQTAADDVKGGGHCRHILLFVGPAQAGTEELVLLRLGRGHRRNLFVRNHTGGGCRETKFVGGRPSRAETNWFFNLRSLWSCRQRFPRQECALVGMTKRRMLRGAALGEQLLGDGRRARFCDLPLAPAGRAGITKISLGRL